MAPRDKKAKVTGYDRYIDWKMFSIPLGLFLLILALPTPRSMLQVGAEYSLGPGRVKTLLAQRFFQTGYGQLIQWQCQLVKMAEVSAAGASFGQAGFLGRGLGWCEKNGIGATQADLDQVRAKAGALPEAEFEGTLRAAHDLKKERLDFAALDQVEKERVERAGFLVQVAVALVVFVVGCFLTEAIPLPMVAFCVGIIGLMTGIVEREKVAALYWSDATWFIMGSLMFAAAFVKTGVDRRIGLAMFGWMKNTSLRWVTFVILIVIAPLSMFMSDHALAAMFLPIGILLYTTATNAFGSEDRELGKMLMITIAMACNLGGSLAPSGAARNIIMMSYADDMFGLSIGFGQWCMYCIPWLLLVIPLTWLVINWRFKPAIKNLDAAMAVVRHEIARTGGGWTRQQIVSVTIFAVMLFCWITENNLLERITGIRFGIGVLAVMGAVTYMLAGIVNWRDYQTKVDWGVVWLYAGAIIFGKILVETGGALWIARSIIDLVVPLGLGSGLGLLLACNVITGLMTQLMADGPACAAVGPVTLAMAGLVHPGSTMIPFMTMSTAIASSLAYCLVIGTPPNAIVYASGMLEQKDFFRTGVILFFTNLAALMLLAGVYWTWLGFSGMAPF
ncbi:MAG: DASS family sodium-coupled anion symporter [Planctomycetes bacterium]|nr:DASS family sodium-coupled anion symporter [Planctomycetota bacterium]